MPATPLPPSNSLPPSLSNLNQKHFIPKMTAEVVTCSKIIATHSLESRQPVISYTHHRGIINCVSLNHTNKVIASCGQDGKIFLVTAEKPDQKLLDKSFYPNSKQKPSSLSSCAFSHNSRYIAVGSVDSIVKLWDLRGGDKEQNFSQIKSHMCGVTSLAWIKGLRSEALGGEMLASASSSGDIYIHASRAGVFEQMMALKLQEGINSIKVSESADYCRMAACTNGGTLAVWDLMSGKDNPIWTTCAPSESKASMTSLSISSYSPVLLVTASVDETLTFFDIHDKKSVKKITAEQPLSCVGLHSNGHTLVAGGMYGNCFGYDLRNPSKPQVKYVGHETTIKGLEFFHKVKEREPSGMGGKAPSVSNSNASIPPPSTTTASISIEPKTQPVAVVVASEIRSKQNIKLADVKVNNFINSVLPPRTSIQQLVSIKKTQMKLSSTGQQLMRNQPAPNSQVIFGYPQQGNTNFRHRGSRQAKTEIYQDPHVQPHRDSELRELRETVGGLQKQLKLVHSDMFDMEERLGLTMIRQFHVHQNEMKGILEALVSREREKDVMIKKLEAENARLKHSTF